ncbi:hypothetical protein SDC9_89249 [bioreactor metagenome]|uniref:Ribbon-helix-helix protein CopG domain-containing protein n=1 Tax=bioreactor metagenome TaxID=1076179 RepID=A0A644ZVB7_9ZZZZ
MKRSVYSLVLSDDVVAAVDLLAYGSSTSRSNMINQILAEYVSYVTPEKRMKDIFGRIEKSMENEDAFQVLFQPSCSMISIKSALQYKYKPTVRYGVELYRNADVTVGELKVTLRTQSRPFIDDLTDFFRLWARLEEAYIAPYFEGRAIPCHIGEGKYVRQFILPNEKKYRTNEKLGQAIADYIRMFDHIMKIYFAASNDATETVNQAEKAYVSYLENGIVII